MQFAGRGALALFVPVDQFLPLLAVVLSLMFVVEPWVPVLKRLRRIAGDRSAIWAMASLVVFLLLVALPEELWPRMAEGARWRVSARVICWNVAGLAFVVLASVAVWRGVLRTKRTTVNPDSSIGLSRFRTLLSLAVALHLLLPLSNQVLLIVALTADSWGGQLLTFEQDLPIATGLSSIVVALGMAIFLLKNLQAAGIAVLTSDLRSARYAFALMLVFAVLAPLVGFLSVIPYGGATRLGELWTIWSAVQLLGMISLYQLLLSDASQVR